MKILHLWIIFFSSSLLFALEPIAPIPTTLDDINFAKAKLGHTLFFDTVLSKDESISCHSCHNFAQGAADTNKVSIGVSRRQGSIQSPTIYNSRYNFKQFWNGRASNLTEQANGPLTAHAEMDMSAEEVEYRLNKNTIYVKDFAAVYNKGPITMKQVVNAIVEFEKALTTPNSRFDRYLRGEIKLNTLEAEGYTKFKSLGCITCHNGINIGANSFQKMGLFRDYPYDAKYQDRFSITKKEYHKNVFKVPTLRNITLTAPYFHDGSAKTLEDAIQTMAKHNLGISLAEKDVESLIAFLKSLEGDRPTILDAP